jgi:hypothetical protein
MKRYVSLAGALLVGTVIATEKKAEFKKNTVAEVAPNVLAVKTNTHADTKKPIRRSSHHSNRSSVTSHDGKIAPKVASIHTPSPSPHGTNKSHVTSKTSHDGPAVMSRSHNSRSRNSRSHNSRDINV